jgi:D-alanyl-D-alanine carboxypeptidase (penicillin-binding protein 5/6)
MKFNALKFIFKGVCVILTLCILLCLTAGAEPSPQRGEHPEALEDTLNLPCKSAILVEANIGTVLYEKNADEPLPPASVTKVMTLLLVMEAIDSGKIGYGDTVRASANACSMGGSQIYLKENEEMTVEDLLKSVIIASANDAAVALAEHICGSEEAFVDKMNEKAQMLGMKNTHFENTNGLDDTTQNHVISARDIAIVSRELIKHKKVIEYSSIWMDSIRNGSFGLTNTNRLIRFYNGATGLKTGSTDKAGFCISATAKRGEMELIAVIMGSETRDERNSAATKLLDYGFNNYRIFSDDGGVIDNIPISKGERASFSVEYPKIKMIVPKETGKISAGIQISENIEAPVKSGDIVGIVSYTDGKGEICQIDIIACENVKRLSFWSGFMLLLKKCAEML